MGEDRYCAGESGRLSAILSSDSTAPILHRGGAKEQFTLSVGSGMIYLKRGDFRNAVTHLEAALEMNQESNGLVVTTLKYHLGMAYRFRSARGDQRRALECFQDTLQISCWCEAHIGAGWALGDLGESDYAKAHFEIVQSKESDDDTEKVHNLHLFAAHLSMINISRDRREAQVHFREAERLDSISPEPYKSIGQYYQRIGENVLARDCYEIALQRSPDDKEILALLREAKIGRIPEVLPEEF